MLLKLKKVIVHCQEIKILLKEGPAEKNKNYIINIYYINY